MFPTARTREPCRKSHWSAVGHASSSGIEGGLMHQRPHLHTRLEGRPNLQRAYRFAVLLNKLFIQWRGHEDAVRRATILSRRLELRANRHPDRLIEISVFRHDERCIAAKFQRQFLDAGLGCRTRDESAYTSRTGEADRPHAHIAYQCFHRHLRLAEHHVEYACGKTRFFR